MTVRKQLRALAETQFESDEFVVAYYLHDIAVSLRILTRDKENRYEEEKFDKKWLEDLVGQ